MKSKTILRIAFLNLRIIAGRYFPKTARLKYPYKLTINLTNDCNSRCEYCDIWRINKENPELKINEVNLDDIRKVFKELNKHLYWVALSGGEITLVKYFEDVLQAAKEECPNLSILTFTTNALKPKKALRHAIKAKELGFDVFVTISLDGDKEVHDRVRGIKGNYEKCQWLYNALKEKKINAHFGLTVGDDNWEFVTANYRAQREKIKSVVFAHSDGIYAKQVEKSRTNVISALWTVYDNYVIRSLSEIIEKIHVLISIEFLKREEKEDIIPCEVLNTSAHIFPNGDIKPCMFMPSLGNIKQDKVVEVYNSESAAAMRKTIKENACPHCWMNCYSVHSIMQHPLKSISVWTGTVMRRKTEQKKRILEGGIS
jgi:MoaA/NifB/PqqE/SkfB family radical SAM enzyme